MALPRGTTGSLWPTFVSARAVTLAVRRACAIALSSRCPTGLSHHRAPPLPFGRRPPQSNCPPCRVPDRADRSRLDISRGQGGISRLAPRRLAPTLRSLPPILHSPLLRPLQSCSKGS